MTRCVDFYELWLERGSFCGAGGQTARNVTNYMRLVQKLEDEHGISREFTYVNLTENASRVLFERGSAKYFDQIVDEIASRWRTRWVYDHSPDETPEKSLEYYRKPENRFELFVIATKKIGDIFLDDCEKCARFETCKNWIAGCAKCGKYAGCEDFFSLVHKSRELQNTLEGTP